MKYLFFDIECSDGCHICSFGYVLVDENMKIIEKDDLIINPESKFILAPKKSRPRIELAYSDEYFYKHGNFVTEYKEIKNILTKNKQILFGHSITSDFRFLIYACKRYNLPTFELEGFDTQKIYQIANNKSNIQSLEKIIDELRIETDFQYHKSSDDAHASFLVAKRLCKKEGLTLKELSQKYSGCAVRTVDFDKKTLKENFSEKVLKLKKQYLVRESKGIIAFSEVFNKFKKNDRLKIVEEIFKQGYEFTSKIKECSIFVKGDEELDRYKYCQKLIEQGKKIKIITINQFFEIINTKFLF